MVFRWGFVLRLVFGVDCGKHFVSSGRMYVEVLGPTVDLMSDKIAYCTSITNGVVGGWYVTVVAFKAPYFWM